MTSRFRCQFGSGPRFCGEQIRDAEFGHNVKTLGIPVSAQQTEHLVGWSAVHHFVWISAIAAQFVAATEIH